MQVNNPRGLKTGPEKDAESAAAAADARSGEEKTGRCSITRLLGLREDGLSEELNKLSRFVKYLHTSCHLGTVQRVVVLVARGIIICDCGLR
jgi:hypothetical protein